MRLVLPFPADWELTLDAKGWEQAIVPGHDDEPDLVVGVSPVRPAPPIVDAGFYAREIRVGLDEETVVELDELGEQVSKAGWRVTLLRGAVLGENKAPVERRMLAVYALPDRFATALIRGTAPERWAKHFQRLGEIVLAAELDWSEPPASLEALLGPVG